MPEPDDHPYSPPIAAIVNVRPQLISLTSSDYHTSARLGDGITISPAGDTETERLINLRAIGQRFVDEANVRLDQIQAVLDAAEVGEALDRETPTDG